MCLRAATVNAADDDRLTFHYTGRVSRGSQQERQLLQNMDSVEGRTCQLDNKVLID